MVYKTWEVMKMSTENPNLKFKNLSFDYGKKSYLHMQPTGFYRLCNAEYGHDASFNHMWLNANDEWALIDDEVDFMTAVKSHNEGKTIYCLIDNEKYTYEATLSTALRDDEGLGISSDEIIRGKWYVVEV